jgi:hypothetical protein
MTTVGCFSGGDGPAPDDGPAGGDLDSGTVQAGTPSSGSEGEEAGNSAGGEENEGAPGSRNAVTAVSSGAYHPAICAGKSHAFALLSFNADSPSMNIGSETFVFGDVGSASEVATEDLVDIQGRTVSPLPGKVLSDAQDLAYTVNVQVPDMTLDLVMNDEIHADNTTMVLDVGDVLVPDGTTLRLIGAEDTQLVIKVQGTFYFGSGSSLELGGELSPDRVLFLLEGPTPDGGATRIQGTFDGATIVAPQRTVELGSFGGQFTAAATFTGAIHADHVQVAAGSVVAAQPFGGCGQTSPTTDTTASTAGY